MNLTCVIVEDEPLARNLLTEYVRKVPYLQLIEACSSPLAAIEVLQKNAVDIMFLDIQMPEITGISLLKALQKKPLVILTTAYSEYAIESYDLDVLDYLLKPITFERFLRAANKASQRLTIMPSATAIVDRVNTEEINPLVFVKDGTKHVKIRLDDILYVEGLKDYVTIHTRQHQKIVTLQRLKNLEEQLPSAKFIRIHHSYIIAFDAINVVHKGDVQIGTALLPISESYKKAFRKFIEKNQMQ